jgi:hypothetical protein
VQRTKMKKVTRSILEELNNVHGKKDSDLMVESSASNIIESAINLLTRIHNLYDEKTAEDLERKFFNSIRTSDPRKFRKSMQRVIESKKNGRKSL